MQLSRRTFLCRAACVVPAIVAAPQAVAQAVECASQQHDSKVLASVPSGYVRGPGWVSPPLGATGNAIAANIARAKERIAAEVFNKHFPHYQAYEEEFKRHD